MHTIRLFKVRKAAIILAAAFSVCALFSLAQLLDDSNTGLKLVRRDGSTITFGLPWKSVTPPVGADSEPVSTSLGKYLDGITNVAVALQNGGILIGDNTANADTQNLAVTINGANVTLPDVEKGNITAPLSGVIADPLASNTRSATSSATIASNPPVDHIYEHDDDCECTINGPELHSNNTGNAAGLLSTSVPATNLPLTCPCAFPATITETWHRTQYAETATLFSFLSVFTVTKTASICHTSLPKPVNTIQCVNGIFVKDMISCPSTTMNGSPGPGSSYSQNYSGGVRACTECSKECTCSSPQRTTCPSPSVAAFSQSVATLSLQGSLYTTAAITSSMLIPDGSSRILATTITIISPQVLSGGITSSRSTNTTVPTHSIANLTTDTTARTSQVAESPSRSASVSSSSIYLTTSISVLSQTSPSSSQASSGSNTQATSSRSSQLIKSSATQPTPPPVIADYGSKVLSGASVGIKEALASVSGLTGGLWSTVLAEINSALVEALSTARPLESVLSTPLAVASPISLTPLSSLPVPTDAVGNAVGALGSLLSNLVPAPTRLLSSVVSIAPELGTPVLSNTGQAVGSVAGSAPSVLPLANIALVGASSLATRVLDTVPTNAVGNDVAILNPVLPLLNSLTNSGLTAVAPASSAIKTVVDNPVYGGATVSGIPVATVVNDVVQSVNGGVAAQLLGTSPVRPLVGNFGVVGA